MRTPRRVSKWLATTSVAAVTLTQLATFGAVAYAEPATNTDPGNPPYTQITGVSGIKADSVEQTGEGANGPIAKAFDGNPQTYWHTRWYGQLDPLPHWFIVKLGDQDIKDVSRIVLTPRQSSNGSGRMESGEVYTLAGKNCDDSLTPDDSAWEKVADVRVPGNFGDNGFTSAAGMADLTVDFSEHKTARCLLVKQTASWGGANTTASKGQETVASIAEFKAFTGGPKPVKGEPSEALSPADAKTITSEDGSLSVKLSSTEPKIFSYQLGDAQLLGSLRSEALKFNIDFQEHTPTFATPSFTAHEATYPVSFADLGGAGFSVVISVKNQGVSASSTAVAGVKQPVVTYRLTKFHDDGNIHNISIPNLDFITVDGADESGQLSSMTISNDRNRSGDVFQKVATAKDSTSREARLVIANTSALAAAVNSNGIFDVNADGKHQESQNRFIQSYRKSAKNAMLGSVNVLNWVHRGRTSGDTSAQPQDEYAKRVYPAGKVTDLYPHGVGPDEDPYVDIALSADANKDQKIDWQDGAIALRTIIRHGAGWEDIKNLVLAHIPFNIVSQATHPFLQTLDEVKRISLATDNLGQRILLKGYQSEGHDSAQGDYGGHYNDRAGGFKDLVTLAKVAGKEYNTQVGVHVNATEAYSESMAANDELFVLPPIKNWGWMNQAYMMNRAHDLGSGNVLARMQKFKEDLTKAGVFPYFHWLYFDVYYEHGWYPQRMAQEITNAGWMLSSEWAHALPTYSTWSHWANDEHYGGVSLKGINSQIQRFTDNSYRDVWNPDPRLDYSAVKEFEGWAGHVNYHEFWRNIWERQLPTKFLQQSNIMRWNNDEILFQNGTRVTADNIAPILNGDPWRRGRTFTFDGAEVLKPDGSYLLPWKNGGKDRLYLYNPAGGTSTFELTTAWKQNSSLKLYEITDQGRKELKDIPVTDGKITVTDLDPNKAYVLYPSTQIPTPVTPNWGEGSYVKDPGFNSGTLQSYQHTGAVSVKQNVRGNYYGELGAGNATLSQTIALPAGTWDAWAWLDITPGKSRQVSVSASGDGVTPTTYQAAQDGVPTTEVNYTSAPNSTASDDWLSRNDMPSYMQRVRVTFQSTGQPVTFKIAAGAGEGIVRVDNLRVVQFHDSQAPANPNTSGSAATGKTAKTVYYQDFENVDTGYFPFVTGSAYAGGDATTVLAEKHPPYSQKGWYGVVNGRATANGKYTDNVLDGNWSLRIHNGAGGLDLRTFEGSLRFLSGHRYRVGFDYQAPWDKTYKFHVNYDAPNGNGFDSYEVVSKTIDQARDTAKFTSEFDVAGCGSYWIGISQIKGAPDQNDLVIDNLRVEDLGTSDKIPACGAVELVPDSKTISEGDSVKLTANFHNGEESDISDVTWKLTGPEKPQWEIKADAAGPNTVGSKQNAQASWIVKAPANGQNPLFTVTVTYKVAGNEKTVTGTATLAVLGGIHKGVNYLSDLPFNGEPANGWGPVERDVENGEQGLGDGSKMQLGDTTFEKGLGVHATSSISFLVNGKCQKLKATIGVDKSQPSGKLKFAVTNNDRGKGNEIYNSGPMAGGQYKDMDVDITGISNLILTVVTAKDNNGNNHGDWADIRVVCNDGLDAKAPTATLDNSQVKPGEKAVVTLKNLQPLQDFKVIVDGQEFSGKAGELGTAEVEVNAPSKEGKFPVEVKQMVADQEQSTTTEAELEVTATPKPAPDPKPDPKPDPVTPPAPKPEPKPTPVVPVPKPVPGPVVPGVSGAVASGSVEITRYGGRNRFETAMKAWEATGSTSAVLVGAYSSADALTGSVLAGDANTSVLFTKTHISVKNLVDAVASGRLRHVVVTGGPSAVSPEVIAKLKSLGATVEVLAGPNRYATAVEVAKNTAARLGKDVASVPVVLADGIGFADSLVSAQLARKLGAVVLLTQGGKIPAETREFLRANHGKLFVVGGPASQAVSRDKALNSRVASVLVGKDRYATSALVKNQYFPDAKTVALANGLAPADALVAGAYGKSATPVLLVKRDSVPPVVKQSMVGVSEKVVFGGAGVVSPQGLH